MTDMNAAVATMRADLAALRAALVAKGHEHAIAELSIKAGVVQIHLTTGDLLHDGDKAFHNSPDYQAPYAFPSSPDYYEALDEAMKLVDGADHAIADACAAWFKMETVA